MFKLFLSLVVGGALFYFIGDHFGLFSEPEGDTSATGKGDEDGAPKAVADLGKLLFKTTEVKPEIPYAKTERDPVIFTAHMNPIDKQEVFSPIPGKILFIGVEVPEGCAQVAGVASFVAAPFENNSIPGAKEEKIFIYRRLYENEVVGDKEIVAKMDITRIRGEVDLKTGKVGAADAMARAGKAGMEEAHERFVRAQILYYKKVIAEEDLGAARLTKIKFEEEYKTKVEEYKLAGIELDQALILLKQHDLRSNLGVKRSRIVKIFKSRGETVKEQDVVMLLENHDRLMAEGVLEVSYRGRIREGDRVRLEPVEEQVPMRTLKGHLGEINAVAVTPAPDSKEDYLWFLSGSEDGTVCIWDQYSKRPVRELTPGEPVRALAVSQNNLLLVGTSDGSLFLYDLKKGSKEAIKEIKKAHRDAVSAVAFSPDGKYFVSGGADSQILLYRTEDGQLLYPFDADHGAVDPHRGTITALHMTPYGMLISASRDNTVRMWEVKEKGAELAKEHPKPFTGRTGAVSHLGVSPNGHWMFLDRGKDLQILSAVNGNRFATLQNPAGGMPFDTLALFSPDNSLIMTAGAAEGRLQLWQAPSATSRGFEVRQFVTPERGTVTCAAFSPLLKKAPAMAISGTKEGYLYLWTLPSSREVAEHATEGVVTLVGSSVDAGSRQIPIRVEVTNAPSADYPEGRFSPGRPVTIVIQDSVKR